MAKLWSLHETEFIHFHSKCGSIYSKSHTKRFNTKSLNTHVTNAYTQESAMNMNWWQTKILFVEKYLNTANKSVNFSETLNSTVDKVWHIYWIPYETHTHTLGDCKKYRSVQSVNCIFNLHCANFPTIYYIVYFLAGYFQNSCRSSNYHEFTFSVTDSSYFSHIEIVAHFE